MGATKGLAPPMTEEVRAEIVKKAPSSISKHEQLERLAELENEILLRSMSVVDASMRFGEIDPNAESPPDEWVQELGEEGALQRFRVAKASWQGSRDAPVGIKTAQTVSIGILRAKAQQDAAPKTLNVQFVQWVGDKPSFEERDIEPGR